MQRGTTERPDQRFNGLELCRFVCALAIVVWHYQQFFFVGEFDSATIERLRPSLPFSRILSVFYDLGWEAVQIFWAISGFIFVWKYADALYEKSVGLREFVILRFSRLYPLHLATLMIVACLQAYYTDIHGLPFIYRFNDASHFVTQLAFASNWLPAQPHTFNGPIWSVSIEVLVYIVFFAICCRFKASLVLCIALAIVPALLLKFFTYAALQCISLFFAGGAIQVFSRALSSKEYSLLLIISGLSLIATAAIVAVYSTVGPVLEIAIALEILLISISIEPVIGWDLSRFRSLGSLTYSSYLIHFPLQLSFVIVVDQAGLGRDVFYQPAVFIIYVLSTLLLAYATYVVFEVPMQRRLRQALLAPTANSPVSRSS